MTAAKPAASVAGRGCRLTPEASHLRKELIRTVAEKLASEHALRTIAEFAGLPSCAEPGIIAIYVCAMLERGRNGVG